MIDAARKNNIKIHYLFGTALLAISFSANSYKTAETFVTDEIVQTLGFDIKFIPHARSTKVVFKCPALFEHHEFDGATLRTDIQTNSSRIINIETTSDNGLEIGSFWSQQFNDDLIECRYTRYGVSPTLGRYVYACGTRYVFKLNEWIDKDVYLKPDDYMP